MQSGRNPPLPHKNSTSCASSLTQPHWQCTHVIAICSLLCDVQKLHPARSALQWPSAPEKAPGVVSHLAATAALPVTRLNTFPSYWESTLLGFSTWLFSGCSCTGMHAWMKDRSSREHLQLTTTQGRYVPMLKAN